MAVDIKPLTDAEWQSYVQAEREMGNELEPGVRPRLVMVRLMLNKSIVESIGKSVRKEKSLYESIDEWVNETLRRRLESGR